MTSKLHGACGSKGGRLQLHLHEGQCSDFTGADVVRKDLPPAAMVIGDQGYDSNKIRRMLSQQGIPPCIPPRRCRKKPVHYSKGLDRKGHKIENLFSRLKDWRRIATRYAGCAHAFRSAILLPATILFCLWVLTLGCQGSSYEEWSSHRRGTPKRAPGEWVMAQLFWLSEELGCPHLPLLSQGTECEAGG